MQALRSELVPRLENPLQDIPRIYYINLTRSFERRKYMQDLLSHPRYAGIPIERIGGCDGEREPLEQSIGFRDVLPNPQMSRSEYGCTVAHFRAIHAFSLHCSDASYTLILEDDVSDEYVPLWTQTLREQIEHAPADWEVLQLSYIQWGYLPTEAYERTEMSKNLCGTAAYVIRYTAAKRLIDYLCPGGGGDTPATQLYTIGPEYPLFHYADRFLYIFFTTYCLRMPPFTYRDANDSLIHPDHMELHRRSKQEIWEATYGKAKQTI